MKTDNTIELKLEGLPGGSSSVSVRSFAQIAVKFDEFLHQVQRAVLPSQRVDWTIHDLRKGSTVLEIAGATREADSGSAAFVMSQTLVALQTFENPDAMIPPWVTAPMVRTVSQLSSIASRGRFTVSGSDAEVVVTQATAAKAKRLEEKRYYSFGSVEGRIESVSIHDGLHFHLYDTLDGYRIVCSCSQEQWDYAHSTIGRRVRVIGQVERRFDGKVESLKPESIRTYPDRSELPTTRDIIGIFEGNPINDDDRQGRR